MKVKLISLTKSTIEEKDLSAEELQLLFADGTMELVSQETNDLGFDDMGLPIVSYNVVVKKKKDSGRVRIENVPPEEFLIAKSARNVEESVFVAHRRLLPRSDLIAMGYDKDIVDDLPTYNDLEFSEERVARFPDGEQPDQNTSLDFSMQTLEVYECRQNVLIRR